MPQIHIDRQGEDLVANLVGELKAQGSPADRRNTDVEVRSLLLSRLAGIISLGTASKAMAAAVQVVSLNGTHNLRK